MRPAVDGHLIFVHGFEQGGLGLGGGAVDLVGQQEVAEDGSGFEFESFGVGVVDGDAEDVGGQHVAGELQSMEAAGYGAGERLGESGLADAGHVLDEEMAAGEEANERKAHHFGLAVNRRADGRLQFRELTEDIGREPNRRGHYSFPLGHYMFMILDLPKGMAWSWGGGCANWGSFVYTSTRLRPSGPAI